MSVRTRGKSFEAAIYVDGRRIRRAFQERQAAEAWEAEARAAQLTGRPVDVGGRVGEGGAATLQALLDLTYRRYWQGSRSEDTALRNGQAVVNLLGPSLPPRQLDESRLDELIFALEKSGNSGGTVNRKLAALSKMLTFAQERGIIGRKPKIERRKEAEHRVRWLTFEEEDKLLATFRHFGEKIMADLTMILVDSGLRLSEGLNLQWKDCEDGWIRVWKNKADKPRSIPMTARLADLFKVLRFREMGHDVFPGPLTGLSRFSVTHHWNRARRHMGLENDEQFVPHALRHTFISRLVQKGVPLLTVQQLAGHKGIQMTMRYAHLAPANLLDAVKLLDRPAAGSYAVPQDVPVAPTQDVAQPVSGESCVVS